MKLSEIIETLKYGELSQLYLAGCKCEEGITEEGIKEILTHMRPALNIMFRRFRLRQDEFKILLQRFKEIYTLTPDHLTGMGGVGADPSKYIMQMGNTFENPLIKIESVWDHLGNECILNEVGNPCSYNTLAPNVLTVPKEVANDCNQSFIEIKYRAEHPPINVNLAASAPDTIEIQLPTTHIEAMLFYIASRVHTPIGMTNEFHAGNSWFAKYEEACVQLEAHNYQIDNIGTVSKFEHTGFR